MTTWEMGGEEEKDIVKPDWEEERSNKEERQRKTRNIDCDSSDLWGRTQEWQIFFPVGSFSQTPETQLCLKSF